MKISKELNKKAKKELKKIGNSYNAQKEFLKNKTFINSFHNVESKGIVFS